MASVADDTTPGKETSSSTESGVGNKPRRPRRRPQVSARQVAHGAKVGSDAIRSRVASVVWIAAVLCAVVLALGALLFALGAEKDNAVVQWVTNLAEVLAGPAGGPHDGIFDFGGSAKNALANWGMAAAFYLIVGRVADRIIRP
jgi:hypothetical protein